MKWIILSMVMAMPHVIFAQKQTSDSKAPRGFTIRLAPSDDEQSEDKDPLLAPDKEKDKKRSTKNTQGSPDEQEQLMGEETTVENDEKKSTAKGKSASRKRKMRARVRQQITPGPPPSIKPIHGRPLAGTGASFGRQTDYGRLETIPPRIAARIHATVGGQETIHQRTIVFKPGQYALEARQRIVLAAISDFLQVSPQVGLVMVEGTANDLDDRDENQLLGEARASAVREFMVQQGIDAKRILAYGLFGAREGAAPPNSGQMVRLRMLRFGEVDAEPATEWNQVAIAGVWGKAEWRRNPRRQSAQVKETWSALRVRDQLPHDVFVRSGQRGRVLLRFPDASRILLERDAVLRLDTLRFDPSQGRAKAAMHLGKGVAEIDCSPIENMEADVTLLFPGGAISTRSSRFVLAIDHLGQGRLTVEEGTLKLAMAGSRPLTLGAGQTMLVGPNGPLALPQLGQPEVLGPRRGRVESPLTFRWKSVPGAKSYLLEVSRDIDFYDLAARTLVRGEKHQLRSLVPSQEYYWRLIPLDKHNAPGQTSQIHRFTVKRP